MPPIRTTDFMLQLQKNLVEDRKIGESTATQYVQFLYKLNGSTPFNNLAWTKKKEDIQKVIDTYSPSTQNTQYAVLTSVLSLVSEKPTYRATYNHWRKKMMDSKKANEEAGAGREKNEKQKENWVEWDDVLEIRDTLKKDVDTFIANKTLSPSQYDKLLQFVVVSLFTDIPPRRNEYQDMYVVKKWTDSMDTQKNYYDLTTHTMIFNTYKTAKKYGVQTVVIPEVLQSTLAQYFKHHPGMKQKGVKEFPLLVRQSGELFTAPNAITRILNKVFGKNVGSSLLRHSYLSAKYGDAVDDLEDDTNAMGNSPAIAMESYIKK